MGIINVLFATLMQYLVVMVTPCDTNPLLKIGKKEILDSNRAAIDSIEEKKAVQETKP
jgi:hypothetical protein